MYNIHYMTHFPLTALCDGVDALLVSTVTLSINVVSNKRVSPCEVGGGGGGGREEGSEKGRGRRRREEDGKNGGEGGEEEGEVRRGRDSKKGR